MDLSNIDWAATTKLILAILTVVFGTTWTMNRTKKSYKTNIAINGNNNSMNIADRDVNNVRE